jgi:hypothetical protein
MLENMPKLDTSNLPDEILEHSEKLAWEMIAVGKIQDGATLSVLVGYAKQQRAEVERLRAELAEYKRRCSSGGPGIPKELTSEGLDDCTHYEGKDGYALVDGATYEAMRRDNERLRAALARIAITGKAELCCGERIPSRTAMIAKEALRQD